MHFVSRSCFASLEHTRIINHQLKDRLCLEVLRAKMSIRLCPDVACHEADCYHQKMGPPFYTHIHINNLD
jgi:hypothetical protein